jgi:hypothetical protein
MFSSQFSIYPDCGRMEHSLKFDPYRRVLPFTRSFEDSPIPGDTTIINKRSVTLSDVRHAHLAPGTDGVIGSVPTLLRTNVSRISPKPPLAAQTHGLRGGQVRCFFACRESRRAYGARSQDSGLSQKLSTRVHGKAPYPSRMGWQLTRHYGIESNQISCTCSEISSFRLCRLGIAAEGRVFRDDTGRGATACSPGARSILGLSVVPRAWGTFSASVLLPLAV